MQWLLMKELRRDSIFWFTRCFHFMSQELPPKNKIAIQIKDLIRKNFPFIVNIRRKFINFRQDQYYALDELDKKMQKYLRKKNGFFIELGANNGIIYSNTLWFENNLGWRGILVEAVPFLAEQCQVNRPKCKVFNCACVAKEYSNNTIKIIYSNLMTIVKGYKQKKREREHIEVSKRFCNQQYEIDVPARTLTSILNECNVSEVDFLSLDVEGFELAVLKGLDLKKYKIRYILIEINDDEEKNQINEYLKQYYRFVEKLSFHDYLYERTVES